MKTLRTVLLLLVICAFAASAAESYSLTLYKSSYIGSNELAPGNYKLVVEDSHIVLRGGGEQVEMDAKVETAETPHKVTSVRYRAENGRDYISEIRLGKTSKKLVFD